MDSEDTSLGVRVVKLEVQQNSLLSDVKELERETRNITSKLDKILWALLFILGSTNPLTSHFIRLALPHKSGDPEITQSTKATDRIEQSP